MELTVQLYIALLLLVAAGRFIELARSRRNQLAVSRSWVSVRPQIRAINGWSRSTPECCWDALWK